MTTTKGTTSASLSGYVEYSSGGTRTDILLPALGGRRHREAWQNAIDHRLLEWGRHPCQFDDEEAIGPTKAAIATAIALAQGLRDLELTPPDWIVPTGDGGVALRRGEAGNSDTFEISATGDLRFIVTRNFQVQTNEPIPYK